MASETGRVHRHVEYDLSDSMDMDETPLAPALIASTRAEMHRIAARNIAVAKHANAGTNFEYMERELENALLTMFINEVRRRESLETLKTLNDDVRNVLGKFEKWMWSLLFAACPHIAPGMFLYKNARLSDIDLMEKGGADEIRGFFANVDYARMRIKDRTRDWLALVKSLENSLNCVETARETDDMRTIVAQKKHAMAAVIDNMGVAATPTTSISYTRALVLNAQIYATHANHNILAEYSARAMIKWIDVPAPAYYQNALYATRYMMESIRADMAMLVLVIMMRVIPLGVYKRLFMGMFGRVPWGTRENPFLIEYPDDPAFLVSTESDDDLDATVVIESPRGRRTNDGESSATGGGGGDNDNANPPSFFPSRKLF